MGVRGVTVTRVVAGSGGEDAVVAERQKTKSGTMNFMTLAVFRFNWSEERVADGSLVGFLEVSCTWKEFRLEN